MKALIWLHEDALTMDHPLFKLAPKDAEIIHIWDDDYLREAKYSLKRLVFIYETLCELPVSIVRGNTKDILLNALAQTIYIPASPNPFIVDVKKMLENQCKVVWVPQVPLAMIPASKVCKRFFQYWKLVRKQVLVADGNIND